MPSEERYIHFNLQEVHEAISMGCIKEKREPLPEGRLTSIEIHEDDPDRQDSIYLHIEPSEGENERIKFDRKFFALSLVFYCQGSGIPIPAKGQKILNIKSDEIIVAITLAREALDA